MAGRFILLALALSSFLGCSILNNPTNNPVQTDAQASSDFVNNGSFIITRLAPTPSKLSPNTALGFLPSPISKAGHWLVINRDEQTLSLMKDQRTISTVKSDGILNIPKGIYTVMHKQRTPLWYAEDTYFTNRNMSIPPAGDATRYLRGALGDFTIFIDKRTPLHSSEIWTEEVGGLRIPESQLQKIYYSVDVGATIEIR